MVEQPFKAPFVAAVLLGVNVVRSEMVGVVLARAVEGLNAALGKGDWRVVKLYMKFLGGLQGLLEGDGVFPVLQDMLSKAVDLQTESNEEVSFSPESRVMGRADGFCDR